MIKTDFDDWFSDTKLQVDIADPKDTYSSRHESSPKFEKTAKEVVTMHEKAYRLARAKYNPFAVGGTEQLGGGSETIQK